MFPNISHLALRFTSFRHLGDLFDLFHAFRAIEFLSLVGVHFSELHHTHPEFEDSGRIVKHALNRLRLPRVLSRLTAPRHKPPSHLRSLKLWPGSWLDPSGTRRTSDLIPLFCGAISWSETSLQSLSLWLCSAPDLEAAGAFMRYHGTELVELEPVLHSPFPDLLAG